MKLKHAIQQSLKVSKYRKIETLNDVLQYVTENSTKFWPPVQITKELTELTSEVIEFLSNDRPGTHARAITIDYLVDKYNL